MFSAFIPSLEHIDIQINSKLSSRLQAAIEKVLAVADNATVTTDDPMESFRQRHAAVYAYLPTLKNDFITIIKEEQGLLIKEILVPEQKDIDDMFCCCVYPLYGYSFDLNFRLPDVLVGKSTLPEANPSTKGYDAVVAEYNRFMTAALRMDRMTGDFRKVPDKYKPTIALQFSITDLFLSKYSFPEPLVPFTSREITAMFLHELGHAVRMYESAVYLEYIQGREKAMVGTLSTLTTEETVRFINEKLGTTLKSNGMPPDEIKKTIDNAKEALKDVSSENASRELSMPAEKTIALVKIAIFTAALPLSLILLSTVGFLPELARRYDYSSKTKTSDVFVTDKVRTEDEYAADTFAIRHGYGADLATALNKVYRLMKVGMGSDILRFRATSKQVDGLILLNTIGEIISTAGLFKANGPHGDGLSRIKNILSQQYAEMKKEKLPSSYLDRAYAQIEQLKKLIAEYNDTDNHIVVRLMRSFTQTYNLANLYYIFKTGNLDKDLQLLMSRVDDMQNNPFYYLSRKIGS